MATKTRKSLQRLRNDENGTIAVVFAIMSTVVVAVVGMAIDYARASRVESRIAAAADAATLAATRAVADLSAANPDMSESEIKIAAAEIGQKSFTNSISFAKGVIVDSFKIDVKNSNGEWTSTSTYSTRLDTTLAGVLGVDAITIAGKSEAAIKPGFPVLDIAMCVDSTGSMTPTLDAVKTNALNFFDNLNNELKAKNIPPFPLVRVRMIYFKDFGDQTAGTWDPDPLRASTFFNLPSQASDFNAFVSPQVAFGGMDYTESGLECLNDAMRSQWLKVGDTPAGFFTPVTDIYPLIVVWTDAPSRQPNFPNAIANPAYPPAAYMPRDYNGLRNIWEDGNIIDQTNKQIVFFGNTELQDTDYATGALIPSGWQTVKNWPKFTVGGTLTEANASMVEFVAKGVAKSMKGLRLTN